MLTSQMTKVTGGMEFVSAESIDYRILCDDTAIIQSSKNPNAVFLPRNCIAFNGTRVSVTDLRALAIRRVVKVIVIPYSLRAISKLNYQFRYWFRSARMHLRNVLPWDHFLFRDILEQSAATVSTNVIICINSSLGRRNHWRELLAMFR
jgi:hypothetical protein